MEDTPVLKWTLAALGVIIACFCLGYFVLGPSPRNQPLQPAGGAQVAQVPEGTPNGAVITPQARPTVKPGIILEDQTDEYEAKLKKAEEEKQKAEEARKKAEEALRLKELEAANPTPSPSVEVIEAAPGTDATPPAETTPTETNATPAGTITPVETKPATPEPHAAAITKPAAPRAPTPKPATPEPKPAASSLYKVQVGSYGTREAASTVAAELRGRGFSTMIVTESGTKATFHVQVGAFKSKATAESTQRELQANGYEATIN